MGLYCATLEQTSFNRPRLSLDNSQEAEERQKGRGMHLNCLDVIVGAMLTFSLLTFDFYLTLLMGVQ